MKRLAFHLLASCIVILCAFIPQAGKAQARWSEAVIKSQTKLVQLLVIVWDDKGGLATHLTKKDFRVFDDGIEQSVRYFSNQRVPVSFVVSVDNSGSVEHKLPFIQKAATALLEPYPDENEQYLYGDEFSMVRFASHAELVSDFTTGRILQGMVSGDHGAIRPSYGKESSTALFDSVYLSVATARREAINKRRAVILITDGGDNHSLYTLKETKTFLEEADTPIFAVVSPPVYILQSIFSPPKRKQKDPTSPKIDFPGAAGPIQPPVLNRISDADVVGPAERRGAQNLKELAEASGGGVFTAESEYDLPRIVHALGTAVRYAYLLEYIPSGLNDIKRANGWDGRHKLKVELSPADNFRHYATYFKRGYTDSDR